MTDYQIIESNSQDHFEQLVNEKLLEGYVLIGGVSVFKDMKCSVTFYHQAVARSVA